MTNVAHPGPEEAPEDYPEVGPEWSDEDLAAAVVAEAEAVLVPPVRSVHLSAKDVRRLKRSRGVRLRRGEAIVGYCGPNGHGKSLAMIRDTLLSLEQGRRVLGTCCVLDWTDPHARERHLKGDGFDEEQGCDPSAHHPNFRKLFDYAQLLDECPNTDVLADEITGIASSRQSMTTPPEVIDRWMQLRRIDSVFRYSTPHWQRADSVIREITTLVVIAKGAVKRRVVIVEPDPETGELRPVVKMWRSRSLFLYKTYDSAEYTHWTDHKQETIRPKHKELFWRPGSVVENAYDTRAGVSRLSTLTEAGVCLGCGGKRAHRPCSCRKMTDPR